MRLPVHLFAAVSLLTYVLSKSLDLLLLHVAKHPCLLPAALAL